MSKSIDRRYWLITCNNPTQDFDTLMQSLGPKWAIGQKEQGIEGTPHYQALLFFSDRRTNQYWQDKGVYAKAIPAEDKVKVQEYCTKEDTRIGGPYRYGALPKCSDTNKTRPTLQRYAEALTTIRTGGVKEVEPDILIKHLPNLQKVAALFQTAVETTDCRGYWVVGAPGLGKSHFVRQWCRNESMFWNAEFDDTQDLYIKASNKWWDGYSNQTYVLIDDLDTLGTCLSHHIKLYADRYKVTGEIKQGHVQLRYLYLFITSNYDIDQLWTDPVLAEAIKRRFIIIRFHSYAKPDQLPNRGLNQNRNIPNLSSQYINSLKSMIE